MAYWYKVLVGLSLCSWLLASCGEKVELPEEVVLAMQEVPEQVDYTYHVKPILSDRCFACHGPDQSKQKADLRLDVEEAALNKECESGRRAIKPGSPGSSELVHRILSADPEVMMPTPDSHLSLSPQEKATLIRWIEQGAEYKPHWAFTKIEKPGLPKVKNEQWVKNGVDRFILNKLEEQKLSPAPEADKTTLLRRVHMDLTGLPPTTQQVDEFIKDTSPNAYEKVVDRLLASPHYGEHMAATWLDAARYADTHGYQLDVMRTAWPYRDWVIKAYNQNLPYDQFVTWQLAGDLLPRPTQQQLIATAFNRLHPQNQEGGIVEEEYRTEYVADRVGTFGKVFLGMTVECARCHDHKYDPISQKDYYSLFAFFNNINEAGQVPYLGESSPTVILTTPATEQKLAALKKQIATLEEEIAPTHPAVQQRYKAWVQQSQTNPKPIDKPVGLIGSYSFDEDSLSTFYNKANPERPATVTGDKEKLPQIIPGKFGKGRAVNGEGNIDLGKDFAYFERHDPFSVSLWINLRRQGIRGPIFARSNGLDNGDRGYECLMNPDGTLSLHLTHNYPDNAIDLQTIQKLPLNQWLYLTVTYDGSGSARRTHIYLNGKQAPVRIRADGLKRSMIYGPGHTNGFGITMPFMIGAKFRDSMSDFWVDELRLYNRALTPLEVKSEITNQPLLPKSLATPAQPGLVEYFLATADPVAHKVRQQIRTLREEETALYDACDEVMIMKEMAAPKPAFILNRGAYDAPGAKVERDTPDQFFKIPKEYPRNRLGLARWLLHEDHPLFARVTVNRLWQQYFGQGLVTSTDDFGNQGDLPTHPQLLDWLSVRFREMDWDQKQFQKMIVMSATYRQSSKVDQKLRDLDSDNRLYARGPSYRMSAEQIRDNALAASGLLVPTIGGQSVHPYQPKGVWEALAASVSSPPYPQDSGSKLYRRSLYTIWKRTAPHPSMVIFDVPERHACIVKRQKTSTPLQALVTMNDPQYVEAARVLAQNLVKSSGDISAQITYAYKSVLSRPPRPRELLLLKDLYTEEYRAFQATPARALSLVKVGDYPAPSTKNPPQLAALTVVCSTIMNMDEAVTKR
ncbi:DUF1553 domain-containing protein [Telluribacter humicola]|uniref:DUF1553 domain-containing protein n=1 Tax=Telluribacter humicola TaxID=1720261 RepID=UPI001A9576ED|nr:DUF1553 domain-containing protein [Telluribacter humicola]